MFNKLLDGIVAKQIVAFCSDGRLNPFDLSIVGVQPDAYMLREFGGPTQADLNWVHDLDVAIHGPTEIFLFGHTDCAKLSLAGKNVHEESFIIDRLRRATYEGRNAFHEFGLTIRQFVINTESGEIEEVTQRI